MNLYNLLPMFMACLCSPFYILGLSSMFWCFFTDFSNCQSTTSWSGLSLDSKRRGDRPLVACCNYSSIMFDYSTGKIIYRWLDRQQNLCNSNRQLWCPNGTNFDQSSASQRLPWELAVFYSWQRHHRRRHRRRLLTSDPRRVAASFRFLLIFSPQKMFPKTNCLTLAVVVLLASIFRSDSREIRRTDNYSLRSFLRKLSTPEEFNGCLQVT